MLTRTTLVLAAIMIAAATMLLARPVAAQRSGDHPTVQTKSGFQVERVHLAGHCIIMVSRTDLNSALMDAFPCTR